MAAQDGIRLRSGLIQTTAETIRPGRIQAVRLVEPLIWRAFGWCRLEVDVAGARQRGENQSEGRRRRALIPVGLAGRGRLHARRADARPSAADPAAALAGALEGAAQLPLPGLERRRTVRGGNARAGSAARPPGCRCRRCRASAGCRARFSAGWAWLRCTWTWQAGASARGFRTATALRPSRSSARCRISPGQRGREPGSQGCSDANTITLLR